MHQKLSSRDKEKAQTSLSVETVREPHRLKLRAFDVAKLTANVR